MMNEEFDREVRITGRLTEGTLPAEDSFVVVHLGMREHFIPADDDSPMLVSDDSAYGVLKEAL